MFIYKELEKYIGTGTTLPVVLRNGAWAIESGPSILRSSISMILRWHIRTRFFLMEFGSIIDNLLEEPNDFTLQNTLEIYVKEALTKWEPRIEVLQVLYTRVDQRLDLELTYRIITSQQIDTFTFPFYNKIII